MNRGERAGVKQHGQVTRIAPIGLDPIAGTPRNECRRDDLTVDVMRGKKTLEHEAARARFVTTTDGTAQTQLPNKAADAREIGRERVQRRLRVERAEHRGYD
jgi:hypothetical protein